MKILFIFIENRLIRRRIFFSTRIYKNHLDIENFCCRKLSNTAPIGPYCYKKWLFLSWEVIVNAAAPARFFYGIRNLICSFKWNYFQLEIRCLVDYFLTNSYPPQRFLLFLTSISQYSTKVMWIWLQTNIIFGISTQNCVNLYMFQIAPMTFIFRPLLWRRPEGGPGGQNMTKNESRKSDMKHI